MPWNQQSPILLNLFLKCFFTFCVKEVCLDITCSEALLRKSSSVCLPHPVLSPCHSCFLSPVSFTLLQKSLLLRAPANQIYYSVPILVSIICQTLARLQSCTPGSQISLDHTLINFDAPLSLPSIIALLNSLPSYPAKSSSEILFPLLQIPSIPLFLSPTIKLMDKMAYLGLQLSS